MSTSQLVEITAQYLEAERSAWAEHVAKSDLADRLFSALDALHDQAMSMANAMGLSKLPEKEAKALIERQAAERKAAVARKEAEAKRIAKLIAAAKAA